jgi:hypothetical protein
MMIARRRIAPIARFLNATGIRPTLTEPLAPVSTREVAKSVVAYTVPLLCYQ